MARLSEHDDLEMVRCLPEVTPHAGRRRYTHRCKRIIFIIFLGGISLFAGGIRLLSSSRSGITDYTFNKPGSWKAHALLAISQPKPIVVLPATQASGNFCRTLFSLLINGYDAPFIVRTSLVYGILVATTVP